MRDIQNTETHRRLCAKGQWGKGVPAMVESSVKTRLQAPHSAPNHTRHGRALLRSDWLQHPYHTRQTGKTQSIQSLPRCPGMPNAALKPKIWKEKHTRHLFKQGSVPKGTEQSARTPTHTHTPYPRPAASAVWVSSQGAILPQRKTHEYKRKWPRTQWWLPVLKLTHAFKI